MPSKAFIGPIIRQVSTRKYAQTCHEPATRASGAITASCNVLCNGVKLATLDNGSPVARVTVAFRAGSRFEPPTELGVSHVLRSAAGLTTSCIGSFLITRKLAQLGSVFTASGDREFVYYTLETTQSNLQSALEVVANAIACQEFRQWELDDNNPRLKFDIANLSPQARVVDLLHKAAFRRTLGNSLFISPKRIGKVSTESMLHYACQTLTAERCAVAIVGNGAESASAFAQNLSIQPGPGVISPNSPYYTGEIRKEIGGELAHVALAMAGAPAGTKESLALACAAKALGCGPVIKWGCDNSPLARAIGNIGPFAVAGFNVSYTDNGLIGAVVTLPKDEANPAVKSVARFLRSGELSSNDIQAGKNLLKLQVLSEADNSSLASESLASQVLYTGNVKTPAAIAAEIDGLAVDYILKVFTNAAQSKLSMASVGNLAYVPFLDELF